DAVARALRGYKEINLRAMRLLAPGGHLCTFSCSYHVGPDLFREMLESAAADAGRPLRWVEWRGQAADHPAVLQIPETAYLKGAIVQAVGASEAGTLGELGDLLARDVERAERAAPVAVPVRSTRREEAEGCRERVQPAGVVQRDARPEALDAVEPEG